ncbi:hypothetical protein HELRODRAFT_166871 [Helobdella robusta]|uniref:Uncharacterized protein n=1 Tax=Helobdella robusta TaxID=6412 RepID=T1EYN9_HELRO|nr:hypothetical protein HELRODRAFT_166871 [Helobdella robusta]ESO11819.1 hypothetical protein HELRODRAFT_166871 [Helobdella robusta]
MFPSFNVFYRNAISTSYLPVCKCINGPTKFSFKSYGKIYGMSKSSTCICQGINDFAVPPMSMKTKTKKSRILVREQYIITCFTTLSALMSRIAFPCKKVIIDEIDLLKLDSSEFKPPARANTRKQVLIVNKDKDDKV